MHVMIKVVKLPTWGRLQSEGSDKLLECSSNLTVQLQLCKRAASSDRTEHQIQQALHLAVRWSIRLGQLLYRLRPWGMKATWG